MFNLKEMRGTYKKLIGECMFKLTRHYAVINKYWNKDRYLTMFGRHLTKQQAEFLSLYWHSIDAIEIDFSNEKGFILYEIRTKNVHKKITGFKPKINNASMLLFNKAIELGFTVKLASVCFHDNWNYSVSLVDFIDENYCIETTTSNDRQNLMDFV